MSKRAASKTGVYRERFSSDEDSDFKEDSLPVKKVKAAEKENTADESEFEGVESGASEESEAESDGSDVAFTEDESPKKKKKAPAKKASVKKSPPAKKQAAKPKAAAPKKPKTAVTLMKPKVSAAPKPKAVTSVASTSVPAERRTSGVLPGKPISSSGVKRRVGLSKSARVPPLHSNINKPSD